MSENEWPRLDESVIVRLMPGTKDRINKAVRNDNIRFDNQSSLIRVAVIKFLREVEK